MLRTVATRAACMFGAASLLLLPAIFPAGQAQARSKPETQVAIAAIAESSLPSQGQQTYQLILRGGPFPYEKDGAIFGNRERLLPQERRGYYREYTVRTPGARDRGARRIICGGYHPAQPEACYYTSDHYSSFRKIVP